MPEPPANVSAPDPPVIVSFPAPPSIVSAPAPPVIMFAPESPVIVSLYAEPMTFSKPFIVSPWASPPNVVFVLRLIWTPAADVSYESVSIPAPPVSLSAPAPPLIVFALLSPVSTSAKADPLMFSNSDILSPFASPSEVVFVDRSTLTPAVD